MPKFTASKLPLEWGLPTGEAYRATIREDIAHMPEYDVEKLER